MPHLESELEADAWPAVIVGIPIIAVGLIVTVGSIIWSIPIGVASIAAAMPIAISVPITISIADIQNRGTCVAMLGDRGRWRRPGRCGESQSRKACDHYECISHKNLLVLVSPKRSNEDPSPNAEAARIRKKPGHGEPGFWVMLRRGSLPGEGQRGTAPVT
jgi:hypothetical protein